MNGARVPHEPGAVEVAPVFPILDTLRLVGALAVLTTHVGFQTGEYLRNGTFGVFLARLDVGVAIFFVLSGFLLSRPYLARAALDLPPPGVLRYAEKRVLRIFPVYVVTVVLALTLVPENEDVSLAQWISSLLLLDAYHLGQLPHGLTHMWSLTAEVAFYAILPLLMLGVVWRSRRLSDLRVMAVVGLMVLVSLVWHLGLSESLRDNSTGAPGIWLPAYLTWFALGIGLAWVHVRHQAGRRSLLVRGVVGVASQTGSCWVMALGLTLVTCTRLAGPVVLDEPTAGESLLKHVLYALVGLLLVGSGVFAPRGGAYARIMGSSPLRHLGHISYSIFCIHMFLLVTIAFPVAGVEEFTGSGLRVWLVTLGLTLIASEVLYRFVELPALRLKGRLRRAESNAITDSAPQVDTTTR